MLFCIICFSRKKIFSSSLSGLKAKAREPRNANVTNLLAAGETTTSISDTFQSCCELCCHICLILPGQESPLQTSGISSHSFLLGFYVDGGAAGEPDRYFPSPAYSPVPNNTHKGYNSLLSMLLPLELALNPSFASRPLEEQVVQDC